MSNTTNKLKQIKEEVIECKKCSLYKTRTLPVVGAGSHNANIMFVGEAPGANEDKTGIPFCGKAGKILDELLESQGIKREDVYICNILKCRPPQNRDPQREEKEACVSYLEKQIQIIRPSVICTLGNHATEYIFKKFNLKEKLQGISKIHGQTFDSSLFYPIKIISMYHPAVATYNANMKDVLKEDFKILKQFKDIEKLETEENVGIVKAEQDKLL